VVALLGVNYGALLTLTGAGLGLLPAKLVTEVVLVAVSYLVQRRVVFPSPARSALHRPSPAMRSSGCPPSDDLAAAA
jgi:hypothetical protein